MQRFPVWSIRHEGPYESLVDVFLANRSLSESDVTNSPTHLHDPHLMVDLSKAVDRIELAIRSQDPIVVFGDYDVDGVTSAALMLDILDHVGAAATSVLPDRYRDGYGMKVQGVRRAIDQGARLIVTTDNGISAFDAIAEAQKSGVDVVVIDHHHPQDILPDAHAIVNPSRPDCPYPFKGLAAVGVVFKVVQALSERFMEGHDRRRYLNDVLGYFALGTVADMMPMIGENRLLTRRGIQVLDQTKHAGLRALKAVTGGKGKPVDATTIAFFLGPRINSAGRLASAQLALDLLRCRQPVEATRLAEELNELNSRRQELQNEGVNEAERRVEDEGVDGKRIIVVHGEAWHLGVIGLIAGRLRERFHRPAIVTSAARGDAYVGSARSAGGYNMVEGIFRCADLLSEYGGHADAAGFSLPAENYEAFRERITSDADAFLNEADLLPQLDVDVELQPSDLTLQTVETLSAFEPFGPKNEPPRFSLSHCKLSRIDAVGQGAHLKMQVQAGSQSCEAIWWREGERVYELNQGEVVDLAFGLEQNVWNGRSKLQMVVEDMRPALIPSLPA